MQRLRPRHPTPRRLPVALALVAAVLLSLAGCSGGDGGGVTGPANFPGVASVEASSFVLVNRARQADGDDPVMLDVALSQVARDYSERMRDEGFFAHVDPAGAGPADRLRTAGVSFSLVGENLAVVEGTSNPADVAHDALFANQAHRRNMLDGRFEQVGVGAARSGSEYWITQIYLRH